MPLAHDILLLHEAGPDRQALASYLDRQGLKTTVCDETKQAIAHLGREGAGKTLLLAHQKRLAAAAKASIDALRAYQTILIVPSGADPISGFTNTVREPFFLDQLVKVIKVATGQAAPEVSSADKKDGTGADHELLRGLAHAINNPLTAALGWLRLLESEIEERDRKRRLVVQTRGELERLGHISQSLALIATPPPAAVTFDLAPIVAERINYSVAEGARVAYRPVIGRSFMVAGNPLEYDLFLRLILYPAQDSKSLEQFEVVLEDRNAYVTLSVKDPKAGVPDPDVLADLGRLLRVERQHRALAIALAQSITRRAGGALTWEAGHPRGAALVLAVPAATTRIHEPPKGMA